MQSIFRSYLSRESSAICLFAKPLAYKVIFTALLLQVYLPQRLFPTCSGMACPSLLVEIYWELFPPAIVLEEGQLMRLVV